MRHSICCLKVGILFRGVFPRPLIAGNDADTVEEKKMRVTPEMPVAEALNFDERMVEALSWLTPDFERLRDPAVRRAVATRTTVEQAARMAHVPLSEALYVLNLVAGEDQTRLAREIMHRDREDFEYTDPNPALKPRELLGLADEDPLVHYVDAVPFERGYIDPEEEALAEAARLRRSDEVVLVHAPFDIVPLRERLARRGFASWAEERRPHEWYIYFYRPHMSAGATFNFEEKEVRPKAKAMAAHA